MMKRLENKSTKESVAIEDIGLDVIAEADRKGKPSDLFMPWFAANILIWECHGVHGS